MNNLFLDARLQNHQRSMLKQIIEIFSTFSEEIKKWQETWYKKYADQHTTVTSFNELWELFATSIRDTSDFVDRIDESIKNLENARKLIPKVDKQQSLKVKIDAARSEVDKLNKELNDLRNREKGLEREISQLSTKSPKSELKRFDYESRQEKANNRQVTNQKLIEQKEKLLKKQTSIFHVKQAELFQQSKIEEVELCQILKDQSHAFVRSLNINSDDFVALFKKCDIDEALTKWEKDIFHKNIKKLERSQSNEHENSSKKNKNTNDLSNKDANEDE
jgi:predicted DNA-binding protein YlxM (UPF0122 family)